MKKYVSFLLALTLVLAMLAGCAQKSSEPQTASPSQNTEAAVETEKQEDEPEAANETLEAEPAEETPATRTVTDLQGRTVEVPATVERVAALGSAARMLTYAGFADKIVGCTDLEKQGNYGMPYAYVNRDLFAACSSVSSGGSGDTLYTEELTILELDVIFYFGADADTLNDLQAQLEVPVIGLYASNFYDEDFFQTLRVIGEVMGQEDHVENVVSSIQGWIEDLDARTRDIPEEEKPTVYTGALGFRGAHGFEGTSAQFPPFVAVHANNVVDETGESGTMLIDLEKVAVWDPDYIFLNPDSMYLVNEDYSVNSAFYDNLTAVQEGRVFSMVSYNYFWSNQELAIIDAYYVGTIIYPEAFADVVFEEKAEEIFRVMLGQDYLQVLEENGDGFGTLIIGE